MTPLAALAWLLLFAAGPAAGQPRFRVAVDAVRVDVLVTDGRGRPVRGLNARDFELRDSGVTQQIEAMSVEDEPVRVLLALDASRSVDGEPLSHLRQAARSIVNLMGPLDRAAIVTFSEDVRLAADWTSDKAALRMALDSTRAGGATALHDAAFTALSLRDPQPGRALVILFSDGADTSSWLAGGDVMDVARRTDAVLYAVAVQREERHAVAGFRVDVGSGVQRGMADATDAQLREPFLTALSGEMGGASVSAESTRKLQATFVSILREFRTRYLLTYAPRDVPPAGWHPIEVRLTTPKGQVTARRGYVR